MAYSYWSASDAKQQTQPCKGGKAWGDSPLKPSIQFRVAAWRQVSWWGPCGVVFNALDCGIVVSEFKLQPCYNVHFKTNTLGKGMTPPFIASASYGLNSTTAVLSQGLIWELNNPQRLIYHLTKKSNQTYSLLYHSIYFHQLRILEKQNYKWQIQSNIKQDPYCGLRERQTDREKIWKQWRNCIGLMKWREIEKKKMWVN